MPAYDDCCMGALGFRKTIVAASIYLQFHPVISLITRQRPMR